MPGYIPTKTPLIIALSASGTRMETNQLSQISTAATYRDPIKFFISLFKGGSRKLAKGTIDRRSTGADPGKLSQITCHMQNTLELETDY
jgi:hypothetical protein